MFKYECLFIETGQVYHHYSRRPIFYYLIVTNYLVIE